MNQKRSPCTGGHIEMDKERNGIWLRSSCSDSYCCEDLVKAVVTSPPKTHLHTHQTLHPHCDLAGSTLGMRRSTSQQVRVDDGLILLMCLTRQHCEGQGSVLRSD
jgi:hypothetical protein